MPGTSTQLDNAALFAILSSLADNKQAIGRRYAYWCNGAPALEAAVAAAAMTQDELGHARTLYPLLEDFTQGEADPRQVDPGTRTLHYNLASLDHDFEGWMDFVATNFLIDNALTTCFQAAQNSTYEPLKQRARKIVQEERQHSIHAAGWVRRLTHAGGAVRRELLASLERIWEPTLCWFGPDDDPAMLELYRDKILDATPATLRGRYLQQVMPLLKELDLPLPATLDPATQAWKPTNELPWSRWNASSRRLE